MISLRQQTGTQTLFYYRQVNDPAFGRSVLAAGMTERMDCGQLFDFSNKVVSWKLITTPLICETEPSEI